MFGLRLGKLGAAIKAGTGSAGVVPLFSRDYAATGSLGADATFTRASTATYVDSNGVIQTAAINTPRFDYSTGSRALLMEPAATNYMLNSGTPATQTTGSLGTGDYVLWVEGAGSAAVTAGTATITGGGTATDGTPDTFTVTGAGTVTVTVTGTLDRFQLELGTTPTSYIPTSGSAVTRAADALSYPLTTPQSEGMVVAVVDASAIRNEDNCGFLTAQIGNRQGWCYKNSGNDHLRCFDGTTQGVAFSAFDGARVPSVVACRWGSSQMQAGYKRGDNDIWEWDTPAESYDGAWPTNNVLCVGSEVAKPLHYSSIAVYDTDQGTAWIEANY